MTVPKKIIVVDDEESIRKMMKRVLIKEGYEVILANDGSDALQKLSQLTVDLIMLDLNMPIMNGITFLLKLRETSVSDAPVLMITGNSDLDLRVESYRLGVYDFIEKPEHMEVMLKRIENGLKIGEMKKFNESIKVELQMAKKLQQYLYPDSIYKSDNVEIYSFYRPLSDVGGDLYDYIKLRDGRIIFFLADVSGHGIAGALFTVIVKMIFRNAIKYTINPAEIVHSMNRELFNSLPKESFVTLFCGLVDHKNNVFEYTNAGHPKPYLYKDKEFTELPDHNAFLGPILNAQFEKSSIEIESGSYLLIYTDGILDLMDKDGKIIGKNVIRNSMDENPFKFYNNLSNNISGGSHKIIDDCTFMIINFK